MADIKTNLRELSVAAGIHYATTKKDPKELLVNSPSFFYSLCESIISNDISNAKNLLDLSFFSSEHHEIIKNGVRLGFVVVNQNLSKDYSNLYWLGGDTQKNDPIDLSVGGVGFSLKEESFILENMGLYKYLNLLTGSSFKRGLHVFKEFAPNAYNQWFDYTWNKLISMPNKTWELEGKHYTSSIHITEKEILFYKDSTKLATLPNKTISLDTFEKLTTSVAREKVFSKWINSYLSTDDGYISVKSRCSNTAGKSLCDFVNTNLNPVGLSRLLQVYSNDYYYAKTTSSELSVFHVPSLKNFTNEIEVVSVEYSVPSSQLNIITTLRNKKSGNTLVFRNECRFSHGQLNGTPEAKMYYDSGNDLSIIYEKTFYASK